MSSHDHVHREVVGIDMLWLGMESKGGPLSWMYEPLLPAPLQRKKDPSRRLNGSNATRAIELVQRLEPGQVHVYAMGRERWLGHVMVMGYHEPHTARPSTSCAEPRASEQPSRKPPRASDSPGRGESGSRAGPGPCTSQASS